MITDKTPSRAANSRRQEATELSIIIVSWNTRSLLEACLDSIYTGRIQTRFETIVVDNGSTDGSQEMTRRTFPEARLVENTRNAGFAEATNQGAFAASGEFVLFLNSDTVINGESLDALSEFMRRTPDAGAAGGRLLNPDGSFQGGYASFSSLSQELAIALRLGAAIWPGYPSHNDSKSTRRVDWISAACLLVRSSVLQELGYLDNEYFMYGEEVDLEFRIKEAGWKVYYLPHVHTIHLGGGSQDRWRRRRMVYRGKILFYRKHYGRAKEVCLRAIFAGITLIKLLGWALALSVPGLASRAGNEVKSNREVLTLCVHPQ